MCLSFLNFTIRIFACLRVTLVGGNSAEATGDNSLFGVFAMLGNAVDALATNLAGILNTSLVRLVDGDAKLREFRPGRRRSMLKSLLKLLRSGGD